MTKFNSTIHISTEKAALIRHYLNDEPTCEEEALVDEILGDTAVFPNGYEMDVCCCGISYYDPAEPTNVAWAEAILFDKGWEIDDVVFEGNKFFSPITLKDRDGNEYTVQVIVDKED